MPFTSTTTPAPTPATPRQISTPGIIVVVSAVWVAAALLLPIGPRLKAFLLVAPVLLLVLLGRVISSIKSRVLRLAKQGDYDQALQLDKQYSRIPGYGAPLQGTILFQAGRYSEAQILLQPLAYDRDGRPKTTGSALYIYTFALTNDGRAADAEKLLDGAVQAPQTTGVFHIALATCLLSQNKDPQRALQLIQQAMSDWPVTSSDYEGRADQMRRLGRLAWALAACGRAADAKSELQQAFAGASGFRPDDMAGLQYFAGETWRALGDSIQARAALNEALRLAVPGSAPATSAQKALARLANA